MKKITILPVLVLIMVLLTACGAKAEQPPVVTQDSQPAMIIAEGRLMPGIYLDQSFSLPGQVEEVLVKEGDKVETGQVLAKLVKSPEVQLALARAQQEVLLSQQALDLLKETAAVNLTQAQLALVETRSQVNTAQENYILEASEKNKTTLDAAKAALAQAQGNLNKLEQGGGVAPDQLAAALARLASANAALASAQATLDAHELKATMAGTVVNVVIQAGQIISAGQYSMTIADVSSWIVKTDNVTENEVVNLTVGQKTTVILDALPGSLLNGEVSEISSRYQEKRGDITYTVTITLSDVAPAMRWGMTAAVQFIP